MEKLQPKAVIFDLGATLIEYESLSWTELSIHCLASARRHLLNKGYEVPGDDEFHLIFEKIKDRYRQTAQDTLVEWTIPQAAETLFGEWNVEFDQDMLDEFFDAYYEPVDEHLYVYEDTLETLEKIKRRLSVVGLISNTIFPERVHRQELKRFGIEPFLGFAVFSSTFGVRKPHPDIFYKAANLAGFAPAESVYVGDRYVEDVEGPRRVGMPAILKVKPNREYPADMPSDVRKIHSLSELENHLDI